MISDFLRLIRLPNLIIMALTMMLCRYCLILPAFHTEELITGTAPEHMSRLHFILLTFATLLIAAGGNVINDRFDIVTDEINRPGKNIIGKRISIRSAERIFFILSGLGSILGIGLGLQTEKLVLAFIHPFCAISLWMYSSYYKRRFVSGNILIAFLSMLLVLVPGLFEPEFYRNILYLLIYGVFAFLLTLCREIIKDIEDVDGDERLQCKTLPIRYGEKVAKTIAFSFLFITIVSLSFILYFLFHESTVTSWWNLGLIFILPLIGISYLTLTATEKKDFHSISLTLKIYMLLGSMSMFPFWYYFMR
jgi:4-hydroxybenzoate polyprenyltransferase